MSPALPVSRYRRLNSFRLHLGVTPTLPSCDRLCSRTSLAFSAMNRRTHHVHGTQRESLLHAGGDPPLAAHLVTPRALYTHHGIYVGNGRVIHYAGLAHGLRRGPVEEVSLE